MDFVKNTFLKFSGMIPLSVLKAISPIDVYLPYHHLIRNDRAPHVSHLYQFKNKDQFEKDLDYLLKRFSPVQVDDLVTYVKEKKPIAPNQFLLTFDDGFKECASVIAPILYRKGIPAIFFLNNDFIGNAKLLYRLKISLLIEHLLKNGKIISIYREELQSAGNSVSAIIAALKILDQSKEYIIDAIAEKSGFSFDGFLKNVQPFLNVEEIEGLVNMGFSIGGHSLSHPYFNLLDENEQVRQAVESTKKLAERFQQKHLLFSFPHSDKVISNRVVQKILEHGIDVLFGIQNQLPELQNSMLHRFNAERPEVPVRRQIKAEMLYAAISKALGRYRIDRT